MEKNILYQWFIEGQTHVGMQSRGAKMSLALNSPKQVALQSNSNTILPPSMDHHKWQEIIDLYTKQPMLDAN